MSPIVFEINEDKIYEDYCCGESYAMFFLLKDIQDNSLKSRISTKFGTEIPRTTLSRNPENLTDEVFHSPPTGRPLQGNLDNCSKFTDFRVVITEK